ncbi:hypothetical protein ACIQ1J_21975 [Streptomyces sp. NPDC097107]|uniref:hypothetical protein n=1 Tax=Streptomyces sp. NPDC097107 TaxID=3366089 RepID=UPI00380336A0
MEPAARLPREAAQVFGARVPATDAMTGWAFVRGLATRTGGTRAATRWDVGSVLGVVTRIAGPGRRGIAVRGRASGPSPGDRSGPAA